MNRVTDLSKEKLKDIRLELGMTQEEFAHEIGVTFATVNRWERGRSKPNRIARKMIYSLYNKENLELNGGNGRGPSSKRRGIRKPGIAKQSTPRRVLVVDAEDAVTNLVVEVIKNNGHTTKTATSAYETGVKIVSFKPHLVILELKKPGIDGFEVCKRIKQSHVTRATKVLAMSAFSDSNNEKRIVECGADGFIAKPFTPDELNLEIIRLLS